jgi:hypothetical protein
MYIRFLWVSPLNEEHRSVRSVYSLICRKEKSQLIYKIAGNLRSEEKERTREKGERERERERERDCVLHRKSFGIGQKFDHWPNFLGLSDKHSSLFFL